jgi:hypothetical protein
MQCVKREIDIYMLLCILCEQDTVLQLIHDSDPVRHGLAESCKIMVFYNVVVVMILLIAGFATNAVFYIYRYIWDFFVQLCLVRKLSFSLLMASR